MLKYLCSSVLSKSNSFKKGTWIWKRSMSGVWNSQGDKGKKELMQLLYSQKIKEIINPLK